MEPAGKAENSGGESPHREFPPVTSTSRPPVSAHFPGGHDGSATPKRTTAAAGPRPTALSLAALAGIAAAGVLLWLVGSRLTKPGGSDVPPWRNTVEALLAPDRRREMEDLPAVVDTRFDLSAADLAFGEQQ